MKKIILGIAMALAGMLLSGQTALADCDQNARKPVCEPVCDEPCEQVCCKFL